MSSFKQYSLSLTRVRDAYIHTCQVTAFVKTTCMCTEMIQGDCDSSIYMVFYKCHRRDRHE